MAAERSFRHQNFRRDLMRAEELKPILLEYAGDAGEQVIIAAAQQPHDARQITERRKIRI